MPGVSNAVFLSYASEDVEAAERTATALRAAGVEVWFDKSELRGGDAWDRKIRGQIRDCALFVPIISMNTQARPEGYFRMEWDLADQRTHLMGRNRAFVMPLCMDATPEREADVPDSFLAVQWTRLPGGASPATFVERVQRLLSGETSTTRESSVAPGVAPSRVQISTSSWPRRALMTAATVVLGGVVGYLAIERPWLSKPATAPTAAVEVPAAFAPPPHSIAVLPFVNMSGDKEQEYFSDGLTEELLNSLSRINELQVAARTSSFSFQGEHPDIATVAHKLNVASVLEGSVRRSGQTIRVTAQLNNAVTGFHLWSQTYDRDLGDVLKLQTDIATAVATALRVTLLGDLSTKIELGGTRNPAAFDAYLQGSKALSALLGAGDPQSSTTAYQSAAAAYSEAIHLDPDFALAFAGRSTTLDEFANQYQDVRARRSTYDKALADARRAIALAPELAEAHFALARTLEDGFLDFAQAGVEYSRALSLAPGNARVLPRAGAFAASMGRTEEGLTIVRRAVRLDPLSTESHYRLGEVQWLSRRYAEAVAAFQEVITLDPDASRAYAWRGFAYYGMGDLQGARSSCEARAEKPWAKICLSFVYDKLGRHGDAEAILKKHLAEMREVAAYQYAEIYAQWGNTANALEWLDTAVRLQDSALGWLKLDPLLDPLRKEPHFQAIERELKFPN